MHRTLASRKCGRAHTLFTSQREREIENAIHTIITSRKLKLNEIKLEIIYKRVRKREREREKYVEYGPDLLFLFLKGMIGALALFSYLVKKSCCTE
jgi:hypothetical protein